MFSATIIVSNANDWMRKYHDRMPVILAPEDYEGWLTCAIGAEVFDRAVPTLQEWPVSRRVNHVGSDDDATLVEPIEA
jgi:putative SOS response-associated peptidase YedK